MKEIKVTKNYEKFKKLEGNRITEDKRVEKIKKSILKVGYITSPILVNENMEIIDGQGRFEALKQLQLPIEYIVQDNIGIKECVAMNVYQTNWNKKDYIKSYADRGIQSYIYIKDLMEKFNINNTSIIAVATVGVSRFDEVMFREGNIKLTQEQYENAIKKLDFFQDISTQFNHISRFNLFFKGLLFCTEIDGIDLKRLKEKSAEVLEYGKLPPIPTIEEVMQFLEELYNKNSKRPTLYIYTEYRKGVEARLAKRTREYKEKHSMHKYLIESDELNESE